MHAVFALQITVGVLTLDHDRRALETGLVAVEIVEHLEFKAVLVRPLHIHAVEHLRPVLRLGSARAGMHFQVSVVLVQLAGKQRFQFVALSLLFQFFQMRKQFRQHRLVFLGLRHLDHLLGILQIRQQILIKGNILVQRIFSPVSFSAFS